MNFWTNGTNDPNLVGWRRVVERETKLLMIDKKRLRMTAYLMSAVDGSEYIVFHWHLLGVFRYTITMVCDEAYAGGAWSKNVVYLDMDGFHYVPKTAQHHLEIMGNSTETDVDHYLTILKLTM